MARKKTVGVKPPASFMQWAAKFYVDYLDQKETDGGWCEDYVTAGLKIVVSDPKATGIDAALLDLAAKAMRGVWHDDPENRQGDLFTVANIDLEGTYTWVDHTVPSLHRRVLLRWATPRQVQNDAFLAQSKALEAASAANDKQKKAARIMAAVGNPDALLWDYRDGSVLPPGGPTLHP